MVSNACRTIEKYRFNLPRQSKLHVRIVAWHPFFKFRFVLTISLDREETWKSNLFYIFKLMSLLHSVISNKRVEEAYRAFKVFNSMFSLKGNKHTMKQTIDCNAWTIYYFEYVQAPHHKIYKLFWTEKINLISNKLLKFLTESSIVKAKNNFIKNDRITRKITVIGSIRLVSVCIYFGKDYPGIRIVITILQASHVFILGRRSLIMSWGKSLI